MAKITLQDGAIANTLRALTDSLQVQTNGRLDQIQKQVSDCLHTLTALRIGTPIALPQRENEILTWLHFRQKDWRYEEIDPAYQRTFEWIFQKPSEPDKWSDFVGYLSGTGASKPYFINGKAGSGKSTLLKYVIGHPQTLNALKTWAGSNDLLVLGFFFWNLGTPLQKNHVGMLRSLLYSVLHQHPELIPVAFPDIYKNWKRSEMESEPNLVEVKKAFRLLQTHSAAFLNICLFVDGIDEFEGDHRDMSLFIKSLVSPSLKVVVSSRPINPCINIFDDCPKLQMQDLTKPDVDIYVEGELSSHPLMVGWRDGYSDTAQGLATKITQKAEGVFLWVKLVVRIIIDALEAGMSITDLHALVNILPSDLRGLYRNMVQRMQPEHITQAAEIFQILRTWGEGLPEYQDQLPVFHLAFALDSPESVFKLSYGPLELSRISCLHRMIGNRIRSSCCGLLEVRKGEAGGIGSFTTGEFSGLSKAHPRTLSAAYVDETISYLHRTVAEFLTSDEVWEDIGATVGDKRGLPSIRLSSACISILKIIVPEKLPIARLRIAMTFLRKAGIEDGPMALRLLTETDKVMHMHHRRQLRIRSIPPIKEGAHWSATLFQKDVILPDCVRSQIDNIASIHTFAVSQGLFWYLNLVPPTCFICNYVTLLFVIEDWPYGWYPRSARSEMLSYLLEHVARPETFAFGMSLWHYALAKMHFLLKKRGRFFDAGELLKIFLTTARSTKCLLNEDFSQTRNSLRLICPTDLIMNLKLRSDREDVDGLQALATDIEQLLEGNAPRPSGTSTLRMPLQRY